MKTYVLNENGSIAQKYVDGIFTGEWCNTQSNQEYLEWLAEGNVPDPYVEPESPQLTPQQKLEASGLTVAELKSLLGLK